MIEIFSAVVRMSVWACWLIPAVLVLRLALKKAPKWIRVLLWGMVAVRLICPFSVESALSLLPSGEAISSGGVTGQADLDRFATDLAAYSGAGDSLLPAPENSVDPLQIWIPVAAVVWLIGVLTLLLYAAVSYWRLHKRTGTAVLCRDNLFQSERVDSPFVLGLIRPKIYLPFSLEERYAKQVTAHERAHICRRDHWWKPLGFLLVTIHWFNPLVWLSYVLFCRDMELACDERVIKTLDDGQKADYAQALLACSVSHRTAGACPLAFGEVGVKERVKAVMRYKKPGFWMLLLAAAACVLVAVCFLTNPSRDSFDIKIVVPAGSREAFVYADEEISPTKDEIVVMSGENLGDTLVALEPVEVREENAYDEPTYLTPGMPVNIRAEKGAWFKIGVNVQNPTDRDMTVYVRVKHIQVRIAENIGAKSGRVLLTVGEEGVTEIGVYGKNASGECQNADGSPFRKGETLWLDSIVGIADLRGARIVAMNKYGETVWAASVPDQEENKDLDRLTHGSWVFQLEK